MTPEKLSYVPSSGQPISLDFLPELARLTCALSDIVIVDAWRSIVVVDTDAIENAGVGSDGEPVDAIRSLAFRSFPVEVHPNGVNRRGVLNAYISALKLATERAITFADDGSLEETGDDEEGRVTW